MEARMMKIYHVNGKAVEVYILERDSLGTPILIEIEGMQYRKPALLQKGTKINSKSAGLINIIEGSR